MFGHLHSYLAGQFHDWDHKATTGIGLVAVSLESITNSTGRIMGLMAIAIGIYCSVCREQRERREELRKAKASGRERDEGIDADPAPRGDDARPPGADVPAR